jgi:hypothetical protein
VRSKCHREPWYSAVAAVSAAGGVEKRRRMHLLGRRGKPRWATLPHARALHT